MAGHSVSGIGIAQAGRFGGQTPGGDRSDKTPGGLVIDGWIDPDFADLGGIFARQLDRTDGGAAVAVYHRGELVVDLWGGMAAPDEPWQRDTIAMCFSTTKGVASAALHVLVARGEVDYDERVATYWPEFAQNGKADVTVRQLISHQAGLHRVRSIIDRADRMYDWDYMVEALAAAAPAYEPGTAAGYHALTYGWLPGEIVRRVSGLDFDEFVRRELAEPLGLDGLYLGCPASERHRVAPLEPMLMPQMSNRRLHGAQKEIGKRLGQVVSATGLPINPRRMINALLPRGIEDVLWHNDIMEAAIPAANGFFTARSLARLYAVLAGRGQVDDVRLFSPRQVQQIGRVQTHARDRVLGIPMDWRLGYHRAITSRGPLDGAFGHFGFGGSGAWADPNRDVAVAMVCNRGTGTPIGDLRLLKLGTAALAGARRRRQEGYLRSPADGRMHSHVMNM